MVWVEWAWYSSLLCCAVGHIQLLFFFLFRLGCVIVCRFRVGQVGLACGICGVWLLGGIGGLSAWCMQGALSMGVRVLVWGERDLEWCVTSP